MESQDQMHSSSIQGSNDTVPTRTDSVAAFLSECREFKTQLDNEIQLKAQMDDLNERVEKLETEQCQLQQQMSSTSTIVSRLQLRALLEDAKDEVDT